MKINRSAATTTSYNWNYLHSVLRWPHIWKVRTGGRQQGEQNNVSKVASRFCRQMPGIALRTNSVALCAQYQHTVRRNDQSIAKQASTTVDIASQEGDQVTPGSEEQTWSQKWGWQTSRTAGCRWRKKLQTEPGGEYDTGNMVSFKHNIYRVYDTLHRIYIYVNFNWKWRHYHPREFR